MKRRLSVCGVVVLLAVILLSARRSELGGGRAFAGPKPNACGCFRDAGGACSCVRKAKCGCPGDCEPRGCDEKRSRELEKEIAAETKKAASAGNKHAVVNTKEHAASGGGEDDGASAGGGNKKKAKGARLDAKQKKELGKLLDAYLGEHPEDGSHTIDQLRASIRQ